MRRRVRAGGGPPGPGVVFTLPGGETREIRAEALEQTAPELAETEYLVRAAPGEAGETFRRKGMPVATALEKAEITQGMVGYLTIPRPNGTTAYLPGRRFYEAGSFEGEKPAVLSVEQRTAHFLRPLLAAEPNDANAEDNIATVAGQPLTIGVHEGEVVGVAVTPPSASVAAGTALELEAAVTSGGRPGEEFDFTWSFGDGTTATGPTVTHTFAGTGTYVVRVTAQAIGAGGSGGESGPAVVVVGNPPTTAQPGAAATTATTPAAKRPDPAGAEGKGGDGRGGRGSKPGIGGNGKNRDATSKGRPDVTRKGDPRARSVHASHPSERPQPVPETPTAEAPLPPTTSAGEGAAAAEPGPGSSSNSAAPDVHASEPEVPSAGRLVEGRLVGDDLGPTTALEEAVGGESSGQGSRSAAGAVGSGGAGVPVVALIVVGLLAAGALYEWRRGGALR